MGEKSTNFRIEVGERVKRIRLAKHLGQEDVGKIIGMVTSGVSMIEKGQRGLDPEDAVRLKRATGVSLDWIYDGDGKYLDDTQRKELVLKTVATATPNKRANKIITG